ncbi:MAG: hypothetical protein WC845_01710 [Candidatus Staskawiczbacteria bacterium]|jgi:hypothetical protein
MVKKIWILSFFAIFLIGFFVGYITMTFDIKNGIMGVEDDRSFWQILNPL